MRIHFKISPSKDTIPFDHQHYLAGSIHKWLGEKNEEHGNLALYSFSRLAGGQVMPKGLLFPKSASLFFSAHEINLIQRLIRGIQKDPAMFFGLKVSEIMIEEEPEMSKKEIFEVGSPIFIKRRDGTSINHILFKDPNANLYMEETLKSKMKVVGLEDDSLKINFLTDYQKASTKLVKYKGIDNRANWCPVIIRGTLETKLFAWNVGLGNSTGIGFGAIK